MACEAPRSGVVVGRITTSTGEMFMQLADRVDLHIISGVHCSIQFLSGWGTRASIVLQSYTVLSSLHLEMNPFPSSWAFLLFHMYVSTS